MQSVRTTALICIFFTLLVTSACGAPAAASPLSASLSELQGTVNIKPSGGDFSAASAESKLEENGQVQTGDDGRVRLDLSTGTLIRMAPSSTFTLVSNEESGGSLATKLQLQAGEIFVILNGGSLDVETPSGVASVRGSYMNVWVDPDSLDVYVTCLEGDCHAGNEAGEVDFTDGEKTVLFKRNADGTYTVPQVEDMTPEDFQKWLDNNPEAKDLFEQAAATMTAMAGATEEPTAAPEPTATEAPTLEAVVPGSPGDDSTGCMQIVYPPAGSALPNQGAVRFEWEALDGAASYTVTFHYPGGGSDSFSTEGTELTRYIESIEAGGEFTWDVTAAGADGTKICTTEAATFTKPDSKPEPRKKHDEDEQQPACTNGQWDDSEAPCYCDYYAEELPSYCSMGY